MSVKNFPLQQPAKDYRDATFGDTGVIFASDTDRDSKQYYVAQDRDTVYGHVFKTDVRDFYEMVEPQLPCKLYYDLELEHGKDDDDDTDDVRRTKMDVLVSAVAELTTSVLQEHYDIDLSVAEKPFMELNSDGVKNGHFKASRHLIFPVYFDGVASVKHFVQKYILPTLANTRGFDASVYTKNRCFRFFGCAKIGSTRVLNIGEDTPDVGTDDHRAIFMSSLICEPRSAGAGVPLTCDAPTQGTKRAPSADASAPKRARATVPVSSDDPITSKICDFVAGLVLKYEDADVSPPVAIALGELQFECRRRSFGKNCRLGKMHDGNRTFFYKVYRESGKIFYTCHGDHGDGEDIGKTLLPDVLPLGLRTPGAFFASTFAPPDEDADMTDTVSPASTAAPSSDTTATLVAVVANLKKANSLTRQARASLGGVNKYGGRSTETFNPLRDVFSCNDTAATDNFSAFTRPKYLQVGACENSVFHACDELLATIWPDTISTEAKTAALNQLTLIEVTDKYVSNLMPRMILLVCPSPDENAGFFTLGIKDDGEVFTAEWIGADDHDKRWRFHRLEISAADVNKQRAGCLNTIKESVWGHCMWMESLDKTFAQVGQHVLEHYTDHDDVLVVNKKETHHLKKEFAHRRLYNLDGSYTNPLQIWSLWSDKKTYKKAVYDPSRPILSEGGDVFNLFTGFGVTPTASEDPENPCPHIMRHFKEVLSSDDPVHYRFWLDALATWVRNPSRKLGVAFVMRGPKGIGKGLFWKIIKIIWGIHSIELVNQKHLTGAFNGHLVGKSAVALNEAVWGGCHEANSVLLSMITEDESISESKGLDANYLTNYWVVFIMANADWCVPATKDNRRFFMPTISERYRGNKEYFDALSDALVKEVPELLHYLLYKHEITPGFHAGNAVQEMGTTNEGVQQMLGSDKMVLEQTFKAGFEEGKLKIGSTTLFDADEFKLDPAKYGKGTVILKTALVCGFKEELQINRPLKMYSGLNSSLNANFLSRRLKDIFGPAGTVWKKDNIKKNVLCDDDTVMKQPAFWFAPCEILRKAFAEHTLGNAKYSWPDADKTPYDRVDILKRATSVLNKHRLACAFYKMLL